MRSDPSGRAKFSRETAHLFEAEGHRTAGSGTIRHRDCYIDCYIDGRRYAVLKGRSVPQSAVRRLRARGTTASWSADLSLDGPAPGRAIRIGQLTEDLHGSRIGRVLVDLDEVRVTIGQYG